MNHIVSTDWLYEHLHEEDLILLDASLPKTAEGKPSSHAGITIAGARFFDLKDKFSDSTSPFPNTIPTPTDFQRESRALGINSSSKVVVMDNMGLYSSPRVWWMFKAMGHENVAVLDGGLPAWIDAGYETVPVQEAEYDAGDFKASFQPALVKDYDDVVDNVSTASFTIVDARSEGRFNGTAPEPRKELKSGSIPNSANIPYQAVLEGGKFKKESELRAVFDKLEDADNLVYSCGSGLTACIIMMAGKLAGRKDMTVYDGSWTEWAELQGLKVEQVKNS